MFENLTNQDMIILGCLVFLILLVGVICIIVTLRNDKPKKAKVVVEKQEPDIKMALATDNIPALSEDAPEIDKMIEAANLENAKEDIILTDDEKSNLDEEEIDYDKEEKQDIKNRSSIEEVLKAMNEDLEKQKYETIDKYEEEQEENAVISYQELLERKLALNEDDNKDIDNKPNRFANSDFISPVFGRLENTMEYPTLKKTVETSTYTETKIEPKDKSLETDEFLNTLKEFRKNL